MTRSTTFGRLLKMAVNGIATYEGTTAAMIEQDLGQQIGLSAAAIQRYKAGHLPPESRTIQLLAAAAVQRGHLDATWLREFLQAAHYRAEDALIDQLCPQTSVPPAAPPVSITLPAPPQPADPVALRNRSRMLARVRAFWIDGVLEQSLHGTVLLELGMVTAPQAVERAWDAVVQQPDCPARPLPSDTPISAVYDELDQALLILGAPGSGKTTLLLELARDLLDRAEQDDGHPVPVVFNLSTWHARHGTLAAWLVDELHTRYQVPRRVAQDWVAHDQVLPLLDGLDESDPSQRESCVAAINRYYREHGLPGLVVCSRIGDYDLLQSRLQLQGAVVLQPLSDEQIARYLDGAGEHLAAVRTALQQDRTLRELAETPLLLSIMSLAYQDTSPADLDQPETIQQRRHHLFETYIQRMFTRRAPATRYAPQQMRVWLHWLAQQMHTRARSIFFLEDLQPDWLGTTRQRWLFTAGVGASVGLLGGWAILFITGLSLLLATRPLVPYQEFIMPGLLLLLLVAGLAGSLLLRMPRWPARSGLVGVLGVGLFSLVGVPLLVLRGVHQDFVPPVFQLLPLLPVGGALVGGSIRTIGTALRSLGNQRGDLPTIQPVERLHWSWQQAQSILPVGVLLGQGAGLLAFLVVWVDWFRLTTLPIITVLQALVAALTGGAVVGLVLGLIGGLTSGEVELRTVPNQGIHQSARHAVRLLLLAPLLTLAVGVLLGAGTLQLLFLDSPASALGVLHGQSSGGRLVPWLPTGITLLVLPLVGVLLALASGGATCLQHGVLRLLLTRSGALPWRAAAMLDYAAERLLLRKVGGGYIFVHRLLLEHIATTPPTGVETVDRHTSAGQPTIRLPAAPAAMQRDVRAMQPAGHARTPAARLAAAMAHLLNGGLVGHRAITRVSLRLTLAMLLASAILAGALYIPGPRQQQLLTTSTTISGLALTADGDLLASASGGWDAQVHIRDGTTGQLLRTLEVQNQHDFVGDLAFAPGGDTLAVVLSDSVQLWDVVDGAQITTLADATWESIPHVAFAPDGRTLALVHETAAGGYMLQVYDRTNGTLRTIGTRTTDDTMLVDAAFTPDSRTLRVALTGGSRIEAWNATTGALRQTYDLHGPHPTLPSDRVVGPVVLSPDGTHAVAPMDHNGTLGIWRLGKEQATLRHTLDGHRAFIRALAFSPDGQLLATGGWDRTVRVWQVADGTAHATLRGHWDAVADLALTDTGRVATGGQDFTIRLWDVGRED